MAAAPVTHLQYLGQNLLAFALIIFAQIWIVIIGGSLYGHELFAPMKLLLLYTTFSLAAIALSLAWNSLYRSKESSFLVLMAIIVLMALLGGIILPIEMLPDTMAKIALVLPMYWLAEGMNTISTNGDTVDFLLANGILLLYALFFLIIGSRRRIE